MVSVNRSSCFLVYIQNSVFRTFKMETGNKHQGNISMQKLPVAQHSCTYEPPHDKTNKMTVCPVKTQISLGIHPVWSESSLSAQWVAKGPLFLHVDSEDWSDWRDAQTGQMPRQIWDFAGRTVILLVLSCRGSYGKKQVWWGIVERIMCNYEFH